MPAMAIVTPFKNSSDGLKFYSQKSPLERGIISIARGNQGKVSHCLVSE